MMTRRGAALVFVLWLIVILGALGASLTRSARGAMSLAGNTRAAAVARAAAESGVAVAVADVERLLRSLEDSAERAASLNALVQSVPDSMSVGEARVLVAIDDPGAQLDVNAATTADLALLLAAFGDAGRATSTAQRIRDHIEAAEPGIGPAAAPGGGRFVRPIRSLDELLEIPGVDTAVLRRAAPSLTIDGDGTINRRTASPQVLRVARGELRDEPSRIRIVARGWQMGHPLTHEIVSVYAISGVSLARVQWREQWR